MGAVRYLNLQNWGRTYVCINLSLIMQSLPKSCTINVCMGVNVSLDVFQEKMANLLEGLEFVRTYLDDLLVICNAVFEEHLSQLTTVLRRLRRAGLKVNAEKSFS